MLSSSLITHMIQESQRCFPENVAEFRYFFAPGRVNLIGEHTDYNGGYVLPAALTMGTYAAVRLRSDGRFSLISGNYERKVSFSTQELTYRREDGWGNYPKGIVAQLVNHGVPLNGADIYYYGDLPERAGLSSSASISMVTAYALINTADYNMSVRQMAEISQRMENNFIGVQSGMMDQIAVGFGKKDHAICFDCQTYHIEEVPLLLNNHKIVITNTNKQRGLMESKYNERREECAAGLSLLQKEKPQLSSLADLTVEEFQLLEQKIPEERIRSRVRHVVTENERVLSATKALKRGDLFSFGQYMIQSHESLRDDYEVTGKELDTLFDLQRSAPGCSGTRMTGAGFGGCTVSIVSENEIPLFKEFVGKEYKKRIGYSPTFYISQIGDGVKEITAQMG